MPRNPDEPALNARSLAINGAFCSAVIGSFFLYRSFLRRISTAPSVPDRLLKKRTLLGKVVSVGDADNFRLFHTPGGYLAGWGWLRKVPNINERGWGDQTIHVRLNGVDAPEGAHFGRPAQPYSDESLQWLRSYLLGRRVRIVPLAKDQYSRLVAEARVWKWTGRKNVSEEMLRAGWAVVYEAKSGAEFNGLKVVFKTLESAAKRRRVGMFQKGTRIETPGQYKRKHS